MNSETLLAASGIILTAGGGVASIVRTIRADFRAERDLTRVMARPDHARSLEVLREARKDLTKAPPDHQTLEDAAVVVRTLASELPKSEKRAVLETLSEGSERSAATYVVRLLDEAARSPHPRRMIGPAPE